MNRMFKKGAGIFLLVSFLSLHINCASIISGSDQEVRIMSEPAGAKVRINGILRGKTPAVIDLERKRRHDIQIEHEGFETSIQSTRRGFNWWFVGNVIFGGLIGMIMDFANGSVYKIKPDEIHATLDPIKDYVTPKSDEAVPARILSTPMDQELNQLAALGDLRDKGVLTQQEFDGKKKQILSN